MQRRGPLPLIQFLNLPAKEYLMTALDTLSTFGSELTAEQLDHVDGGLLPLIIALAVFDAVLWGYIAYTQ